MTRNNADGSVISVDGAIIGDADGSVIGVDGAIIGELTVVSLALTGLSLASFSYICGSLMDRWNLELMGISWFIIVVRYAVLVWRCERYSSCR